MKTDVQVAVIVGRIVGASVLYRLAKILIECRELTSGSTWHAAEALNSIRAVYANGYQLPDEI